jgi:hypothetical protein
MRHVWKRGEGHVGFWWGNLGEENHLENSGIDGRIILRLTFRKWNGGMDGIVLAQDKDCWRALGKHRVP